MKDQKTDDTDLYLRWLYEARGLSQTTISHYNSYYKHFKKRDLTQENINAFLQQKKNNSVVRGFIKSFLEFLLAQDLIDEDQFEIPKQKTGKKKKRIITNYSQDQIRKVRDYSYKQSFRDGLLFDLIYYGALRRIEVLSIKVNSFDWSTYFEDPEKYCKLLILGKGKKQREVLINSKTIKKLLDRYLKTNLLNVNMTPDVVINTLTSNNSPLFKGMYYRHIHRIITRNSERSIGIAMRPHELRHTRATELENSGASIRSVQHYLGHSTPQITEIYLHTTQSQSLQKISDLVND